MEASTTSTEASIAFMEAGGGSFHESGGSLHGSVESFRDFHGNFHHFHGSFYVHGSWKLPWKLLVQASVDMPSGNFHGSFRGTGFTSIIFGELPPVIVYFHKVRAVSGGSHCIHESFRCFHVFRGSFQGAASTSTGFHVVPLTSTCVHFVP